MEVLLAPRDPDVERRRALLAAEWEGVAPAERISRPGCGFSSFPGGIPGRKLGPGLSSQPWAWRPAVLAEQPGLKGAPGPTLPRLLGQIPGHPEPCSPAARPVPWLPKACCWPASSLASPAPNLCPPCSTSTAPSALPAHSPPLPPADAAPFQRAALPGLPLDPHCLSGVAWGRHGGLEAEGPAELTSPLTPEAQHTQGDPSPHPALHAASGHGLLLLQPLLSPGQYRCPHCAPWASPQSRAACPSSQLLL